MKDSITSKRARAVHRRQRSTGTVPSDLPFRAWVRSSLDADHVSAKLIEVLTSGIEVKP